MSLFAEPHRFVRGPLKASVIDVAFSDSTALYDRLPPTWAAGGFK